MHFAVSVFMSAIHKENNFLLQKNVVYEMKLWWDIFVVKQVSVNISILFFSTNESDKIMPYVLGNSNSSIFNWQLLL